MSGLALNHSQAGAGRHGFPGATFLAKRRVNGTATSSAASRKALRDRVVLEHLPLVKSIAARVHETLPVHVELEDLTHAGILGLFDAASKYDPEKQVTFPSYARHRIRGAILDSLRQLDWAPRDLRRRHRQVEAVTQQLSAELQRKPTEAELANRMGIDVERWRQLAADMHNSGLVSADRRGVDHDDLPAPEYAGPRDKEPDTMCAREQMRFAIEKAMGVLPERYRQVIRLYYFRDVTMKEIGGVLGINESRVSQIHKLALEKMSSALKGAGIPSSAVF